MIGEDSHTALLFVAGKPVARASVFKERSLVLITVPDEDLDSLVEALQLYHQPESQDL
jgi:hypothetical protein